jgi:phage shock protein A
MYGALFRWLKAIGYLLTGRMDAARRQLDTNPHVVRAKFDEIVRDKTARVQQYKQAVAALIAQQESKMAKVKALTEESRKLEDLKTGALAKARQRVARLQGQGRPKEDIQKDEEYMKCLSAYNDFTSTAAEKLARIEELEGDVQEYGRRIGEHKVQLQALVREIEKVKAEAADTMADMITAREEKEIADTLSGIAEDGTAQELQRMRELRQEMKAEARISGELAGTNAKAQEAEFLDYARRSTASDEFESLVGLAAKTDAAARGDAPAAALEKAREKLPE